MLISLNGDLLMNMNNISTPEIFETGLLNISANKAKFTILHSNSQIIAVNSVACQLINYNSDELCSMMLENIIHDSYKQKWSNLKREFFEDLTHKSCSNEKLFRLISKNDDIIVGSLYLKKLDDPEKCLVMVESIDQKEILVSLDQEGKILSFDEQVAFLFQYDTSELVGINIHVILPAFHLGEHVDLCCCKSSKQYVTGRTKNGDAFPVCVTTNFSSSNPEMIQVVVCTYLELDGLLILNEKLSLKNCNNYFVKLFFGHSRKEVINKPIISLIPTFFKDIKFQSTRKHQCQNELFSFLNESPYNYSHDKSASCGSGSIDNSLITANFNPEFSSNCTSDSKSKFFDDSNIDVQNSLTLKAKISQNAQNERFLKNKCQFHPKLISEVNCDEEVKCEKDWNLDMNVFDECPSIKGVKFVGFGYHSDGSYIKIKYQVIKVALNNKIYYCVLISLNLPQFIESNHELNILDIASLNKMPPDSSFSKDNIYYEQLSRHYNSSQCEKILTVGEYSQHYTNLMDIGKGVFQHVKMAARNSDGLLVVTKFIRKQHVDVSSWVYNADLNMKIPLEISFLVTLQHPNIVKVLDVFQNDLFIQLVMEKHGAGLDLFEFIERRPNCDEKLKSYIFRQIVSAVSYLHSLGILHRDIKDENIIINEKFEVKLIDFGAAAFMPPDESFSKFYGTVEYCSPEVLQGNRYRGPELEVWALGVTLYILTFGENPFCDFEDTITKELSIPSPISEELNKLLHKMLEKDVKLRITVDKLIENSWINQPVSIEDYKFESVLCCHDREAHPQKYVFEISSEDCSETEFESDGQQKMEANNSNNGLLIRNADALTTDFDDENQQLVKNFMQ